MEVKVGQLWYHAGSQRDWTVIAVGKSYVIIAHGEAETPISMLDLVSEFDLKADQSAQPHRAGE